MRPVRSNSLNASTSPDPQIPSGFPSPITRRLKLPSLGNLHFLNRAVQRRHAACNRAAFKRRPRRARCRENPMPVPDDQLRVRSDIHHRNQPLFMRQVHGQHCGRSVGSHVAADDRSAVHARLGMNRQKAAQPGLDKAGRCALAFGHFDFGDRPVWALPDRMHVLPEEKIAHRRVAHHHHLVDGLRIDREISRLRGSGSRPASASAAFPDGQCRTRCATSPLTRQSAADSQTKCPRSARRFQDRSAAGQPSWFQGPWRCRESARSSAPLQRRQSGCDLRRASPRDRA